MRALLTSVVLALFLLPTRGLAQEVDGRSGSRSSGIHSGAALSLLSGKALGGASALHLQAGWPGLQLSYLTGLSDTVDVGARFGLVYAYEGITRLSNVPGMKAQGILRVELLERERFNLGLRFSPGLFTYFFPDVAEVGLTLPVDLTAGFALTPKTMLSFGMDLPMFVVFGPYSGLVVPVLFGVGVEHALDSQLAVTFNLRAGPSVPLTGHGYYGYWGNFTCYDWRGRPYTCGGYGAQTAAAEALVGLIFRM